MAKRLHEKSWRDLYMERSWRGLLRYFQSHHFRFCFCLSFLACGQTVVTGVVPYPLPVHASGCIAQRGHSAFPTLVDFHQILLTHSRSRAFRESFFDLRKSRCGWYEFAFGETRTSHEVNPLSRRPGTPMCAALASKIIGSENCRINKGAVILRIVRHVLMY